MAKRSTVNRQGSGTGRARAKSAGSGAKTAKAKKRTAKPSSPKRTTAGRGGVKRTASKRVSAGRRGAKRTASKRASTPAGRGRARTTASARAAARAPRASRTGSGKAPAKTSKLGRVAVAVGGTVAGAVAAVARTVSRRPANDAIALLERDHRHMEELLKRAEDTTPAGVERRRDLLDSIASELRVHEAIEEQVFYPALRQHPEAKDLVLEGFEEHHAADVALRELGELPPGAEQWGPKLKVLQEMIQHHIDEEEGEMFKAARSVLDRAQLAALGREMAAMKAEARTS